MKIKKNLQYFLDSKQRSYRIKHLVAKFWIIISNIVFPFLTFLLLVISTFKLAGDGWITPFLNDNFIIISAFIAALTTFINSIISFFCLNDKVDFYKECYYALIIEEQKFNLTKDWNSKEDREFLIQRIYDIIHQVPEKEANNE